jgi:hypothetical protein
MVKTLPVGDGMEELAATVVADGVAGAATAAAAPGPLTVASTASASVCMPAATLVANPSLSAFASFAAGALRLDAAFNRFIDSVCGCVLLA